MDDDDDTEPIGGVPGGHDEIFARATTSSFGETTLSAANRTWATAGDTGTATWNQGATSEEWNTVTLAIAPPELGVYQLESEHVVSSIASYENYNLTTRAYRSAEIFYLQLYNFSSLQWVNMSTIAASSLTWYNMTLAEADFVNNTNQARIRYWQGVDATQEVLYVDYCGVYGWNATNYELDLEGQWTDLPYSLPNEELSIYGGTMGTEGIKVDAWNGSSWEVVFTDLSSGWNNVTITDWLTTSILTIRFKGENVTGDTSQDSWQIDVALIHVWNDGGGENYEIDLEVQWTNVDYTESNEELCIYGGSMGAESINVDVWNGASWQNVFTDLSNGWNNVTITSYLTSSTFTIRFKGNTETNDTVQDIWNIDATVIHAWT